MKTLTLTIKGGSDKDGRADAVNEVEIVSGEIIGIVRPDGIGEEHAYSRHRAVRTRRYALQAVVY